MKTIYLDCQMGAAGDMLMGALLELLPEREAFIERLNHIGLPEVTVEAYPDRKCGICGTHIRVRIRGTEEQCGDMPEHTHIHGGQAHLHEGHTHAHEEHTHSHTSLADIEAAVGALQVADAVKRDIMAVYGMLAEAESRVHGKPAAQVHFHEVGMMDALADIAGCTMLIHELGAEQILASPIRVGWGQVRCAHGILPVPAPATAYILQGIPCYAGELQGELCTPTGAALLKYFVSEFVPMPLLQPERIGYGTGTKDLAAANCVRAVLGETGGQQEQITELKCNIDDMTGEELGYAAEALRAAGALDVYTAAVQMKKSRPGVLLSVLCSRTDEERMIRQVFRYTTTLGLRIYHCQRSVLKRSEYMSEGPFGAVRVKRAEAPFGAVREKAEYEDLKRIAAQENMTLRQVRAIYEKGN